MVQFQHRDKIWIQFRALTPVVIHDPVPQCCIEMVMPDGSVNLHEASTIHQFRIRHAIDDWGVDSTVGESRT